MMTAQQYARTLTMGARDVGPLTFTTYTYLYHTTRDAAEETSPSSGQVNFFFFFVFFYARVIELYPVLVYSI